MVEEAVVGLLADAVKFVNASFGKH